MDYNEKATLIFFLLVFSLSFISCQHFSKEIINEEDAIIQAEIDSLFLRFKIDRDKKDKEREINGYREGRFPHESIDSFNFIIPEPIFDNSYSQIVSVPEDSLLYDEYYYRSNGILKYKFRDIYKGYTRIDVCYEFNEKEELIKLIKYEECKAINRYDIIALFDTLALDFVSITLGYKEKKEYQKDNLTYIKYNIPTWEIEILAPYDCFYLLRINALTGEVEANWFWEGEFDVCEEGSSKYSRCADDPLFRKSYIDYKIYRKNQFVH